MKSRSLNTFIRNLLLLVLVGLLPALPASADDAPPAQQELEAGPSHETQPVEIDAEQIRHWLSRAGRARNPGEYERGHDSVREAFRSVVSAASKSTVGILVESKPAALGVVVGSDGYVLTKHSELNKDVYCQLRDGQRLRAQIVGIHPGTDLAMLKIDMHDLAVIQWAEEDLAVGSFLATTGMDEAPLAIGVLSVVAREIAPPSGILGILIGDDEENQAGPRVDQVMPDSGAEEAGLQVNDIILSVNGKEVDTRPALIGTVQKYQPGQKIRLSIIRGGKSMVITATLGDRTAIEPGGQRRSFQNALGGELSDRRAGFPSVLQHDTVLAPEQCGGPLVDLDGNAVGINIARSGRVSSYALPVSVIKPLIAEFLAGNLSPELAAKQRIEKLSLEIAELQKSESELAKQVADMEQLLKSAQDAEAAAQQAADEAAAALKQAQKETAKFEAAVEQAKLELSIAQTERESIEAEKTTLEKEVTSDQ